MGERLLCAGTGYFVKEEMIMRLNKLPGREFVGAHTVKNKSMGPRIPGSDEAKSTARHPVESAFFTLAR